MAQLWVKDAAGRWGPEPLDTETLIRAEAGVITTHAHDRDPCGAILAQQHEGVTAARWIFLFSDRAEVRVNGTTLRSGIRVLRDRDAIHLDGAGPVFFSTERLAEIQAFPGAEQPIYCPRCKLPIDTQHPAVQCPQCRNWHHESEDRPCWRYAEHCALCSQLTALDAGYRWTPEVL